MHDRGKPAAREGRNRAGDRTRGSAAAEVFRSLSRAYFRWSFRRLIPAFAASAV